MSAISTAQVCHLEHTNLSSRMHVRDLEIPRRYALPGRHNKIARITVVMVGTMGQFVISNTQLCHLERM